MKKPRNIVYGVDDIPPRGMLLLSGVQHVGLVAIFLLVPVIACREAGMPAEKIIASTEGQYRLAGYMLRNLADRVQVNNRGGRTTVAFYFDH